MRDVAEKQQVAYEFGQDLLERDAELDALRQLIASATGHSGRVALVQGAAGIGKTSLLREALAIAGELDCATATARGSEHEREFAFGVVRQLFEPLLACIEPEERGRSFAGAARLAAPLLEPLDAAQLSPRGEGFHATLHGLYWLTVNLATDRPLALLVDDAHWADAPSLRFLAYLANRIDGLPVVLALALRPSEPGAQLELLEELASSAGRPIRPAPLSSEAVDRLVSSSLGSGSAPAFTTACLEASAGNPLLLRELLATLGAEGIAPDAALAERVGRVAPKSVARSVARRLRRLPPATAALARALAVLGGDADLVAAAKLAELDAEQALVATTALEQADIIKAQAPEFVHPVVRASIYAEISPPERAQAHRRAALALAKLGADDDRIALQLLAGEPDGDPWAADVLRGAGRTAHVRGAPDVAASYFERAVAEPPADGQRLELLMELGRAELAAGRPHGLVPLRKALGLASEPRRRAEVSLELARALTQMFELVEAAMVLEEALADLKDGDPELRERLDALLLAVCVPEPSLLGRVFDRFMTLLKDPSGESDPLVLATLAAASSAIIAPAAKGAELAERALADRRLSIEDDPSVFAYAISALGSADRLERVRSVAEDALATARRRGALPALCMASMFRAVALVRMGSLPAAEADTRYALENMHEDVVLPVPMVLAPLIDVLVERGELAEAGRMLERYGLEGEVPDMLAVHVLLESRARLRMAQGRLEEAIADLRECGRRQQTWMVRNPGTIPWRGTLALALAAAGQPKEGLRHARREIELAREFAVPRELGMALRAAGLIEPGDRGIDVLRTAVSVLEGSPAELEHARALTDLGAALRRKGQRSAARAPLQKAIDLARRCGALVLAERAHTELVATGARPRRLAFSGVDALTASERRVAEMGAEGLTNREIAQALFVTEKTVETHLSHAYRKLDITSRSELPAALRRREP